MTLVALQRVVNTETPRQTSPLPRNTFEAFLEITPSAQDDADRHHGDVGLVVSAARHALGLTQSEFAVLIGCTQALVSKYERARADPPAALVIRCLHVLLDPLWGPAWLEQALATHSTAGARHSHSGTGSAVGTAQRTDAA